MSGRITCLAPHCSGTCDEKGFLCAKCLSKVPKYWLRQLEKAQTALDNLPANASLKQVRTTRKQFLFVRDTCIGAAANPDR